MLALRWLCIAGLSWLAPAVAAQGSEAAPAGDGLTAQAILEAMGKAYAGCTSYRDSGSVETTFLSEGGTRVASLTFSTAFVRPDKFRFEYQEDDGTRTRYIVWRNGADVRTWWTLKGEVTGKTLSLALAGATGVSSGTAHTVPVMLLPEEVSGASLTNYLENVERMEDSDVGGASCYALRGTHGTSRTALWIDRRTHLLREIDQETQFDDFRTVRVTSYEPSVDAEIEDSALAYAAPGPEAVRKAGTFPPPKLDLQAKPLSAAFDFGWDLHSLDGAAVDPAALRGKVIFLNRWATWCPPCVAELPSIVSLREKVGARLGARAGEVCFLCVSSEPPSKLLGFRKIDELGLPAYVLKGAVPAMFETQAIPATFILDRQGQIVVKHIGAASWDDPSCVDYLVSLAGSEP
jgi:thiol-disulfide isomerase/thioredoxin